MPERSIYHCKAGIHSRKTVLITAKAFRPARKTTLVSKLCHGEALNLEPQLLIMIAATAILEVPA
jgi:hypothetical protein